MSCGAGEGAEAAQGLGVDPGGFSLAIGVEGVEADLDPFAEADGLDVVDGNTILQGESGDVGAERKAAPRRQIPEIDHDAAADVGAHDGTRIA